jgi:hypothetical protein
MPVDLTQFFHVFRENATVPVLCFQAATEPPGGILQGWIQPEAGYELEDGAIVSQRLDPGSARRPARESGIGRGHRRQQRRRREVGSRELVAQLVFASSAAFWSRL